MALLGGQHGQQAVRIGVRRVQLQAALEAGNGLGRVVLLELHHALVVHQVLVVGEQLDTGSVSGQRVVNLLQRLLRGSQGVVGLGLERLQGQRPAGSGHGFGMLAGGFQAHGQLALGGGVGGVAGRDGLVPGGRTGVVFLVVQGHALFYQLARPGPGNGGLLGRTQTRPRQQQRQRGTTNHNRHKQKIRRQSGQFPGFRPAEWHPRYHNNKQAESLISSAAHLFPANGYFFRFGAAGGAAAGFTTGRTTSSW